MKRLIIIPLIALAGCVSPTSRDREPAPQATLSEADIQLLALEVSWNAAEICPPYRELLASGISRSEIERLALQYVEEGYGERLLPATKERLFELLHDC